MNSPRCLRVAPSTRHCFASSHPIPSRWSTSITSNAAMTLTATTSEIKCCVSSRLARVTGGGQAYRCGGEEFAIVFPGKTTRDVLDPLEQLRASIEASTFRLRGKDKDRRQEARGPDRRNQRPRARTQASHAIRQLSRATATTELSVTASIGVATSTQQSSTTEEVVKAADKALYRAKAAGRNRIETASSARRRTRSKAAGIA